MGVLWVRWSRIGRAWRLMAGAWGSSRSRWGMMVFGTMEVIGSVVGDAGWRCWGKTPSLPRTVVVMAPDGSLRP